MVDLIMQSLFLLITITRQFSQKNDSTINQLSFYSLLESEAMITLSKNDCLRGDLNELRFDFQRVLLELWTAMGLKTAGVWIWLATHSHHTLWSRIHREWFSTVLGKALGVVLKHMENIQAAVSWVVTLCTTSLHGVTKKKKATWIFIAVNTPSLEAEKQLFYTF